MRDNEELSASLHLTDGLESQIDATALRGQRYGNSRHTLFENGVLVMELVGPIYPRANMMTSSGAISLQQFTNEFVQAMGDPEVSGVVLNIDSPGGDVRGLADASNLMHSLSRKRKKPVKSFASGYMASAAYHIGSMAQEVVGSRGAIVGSIGVVSKAQALPSGQYEIVSSQSPYKRTDPATEDGQAVIREMCNDVAAIMIEDIATFRGVSQEKVLSDYGQGKTLVGPRAKKQGLIDSIGTLASVVESVAKEAQSGSYRQVTKRKVSAELAEIISFTNEEKLDMGLKDLVSKFRATDDVIDEAVDDKQALSDDTTEESTDTVVEDEGHNPAGDTAETPEALRARRDVLEDTHAEAAELFATQMTIGNKVLPAAQAHCASDFLNARIDDALYGGTVSYVNAEGAVVEGTREAAVRARYAAMPEHSFTKKAVAGLKDKSVAAKVLNEEDDPKAKESEGPMSEERRKELLSLTSQGQRVLANSQGQ